MHNPKERSTTPKSLSPHGRRDSRSPSPRYDADVSVSTTLPYILILSSILILFSSFSGLMERLQLYESLA